MPARTSIQFWLRWPTCGGAQLFVGSMAAALVALSFIAGMEVSVATARMRAEPSGQIVNRTQKSDRLLGSSTFQLNVVKQPGAVTVPGLPDVNLKLPDGCDSLVSPIADDRLARVAGRCVS
jgi:hypothetical protein